MHKAVVGLGFANVTEYGERQPVPFFTNRQGVWKRPFTEVGLIEKSRGRYEAIGRKSDERVLPRASSQGLLRTAVWLLR